MQSSCGRRCFNIKEQKYPNLYIVANLVMILSGSNSTVERACSLLPLLLTDQCLSLSHNTISISMTINVNDKLWTPNKKSSIIKSATEAYEKAKRCVRVFDDPPAKVPRLDEEAESENEIESHSDFETSDTDKLV